MKKEVIIALIDKWSRDSEAPEFENTPESPDAQLDNTRNEGKRRGIRKCCQDLSSLIGLLD